MARTGNQSGLCAVNQALAGPAERLSHIRREFGEFGASALGTECCPSDVMLVPQMSLGSQPVFWTLMWLRGGLSGGVNASIENSTTFTGAFLFLLKALVCTCQAYEVLSDLMLSVVLTKYMCLAFQCYERIQCSTYSVEPRTMPKVRLASSYLCP
jgi:hypothetical protein